MQFEPIYTAPRGEAARALRRRLALVERQDALALAQERQDGLISRRMSEYAAPAEKADARSLMRWYLAWFALFAVLVMGGMSLLMVVSR